MATDRGAGPRGAWGRRVMAADRHPQHVQSHTLGNDVDSKSTLLGLFRSVTRSDAAVHVIDCRAQADGLIVQAMESLQLLEALASQDIRFTFFLFPSEDTESMNNLMALFYFAGDRVDYVVVHNRARARNNLFQSSALEAELRKFGAKQITLPVVTFTTLLAIKRAEAKAGRELSFAEVATVAKQVKSLMENAAMEWKNIKTSTITERERLQQVSNDLQNRFAWRVIIHTALWLSLAVGFGIFIGHYWIH